MIAIHFKMAKLRHLKEVKDGRQTPKWLPKSEMAAIIQDGFKSPDWLAKL